MSVLLSPTVLYARHVNVHAMHNAISHNTLIEIKTGFYSLIKHGTSQSNCKVVPVGSEYINPRIHFGITWRVISFMS
jgi:hypothetical protein